MPTVGSYLAELNKVRAAQDAIEDQFLQGDASDVIDHQKAKEIKDAYWEVYNQKGGLDKEQTEGPPSVLMARRPLVNSWNC